MTARQGAREHLAPALWIVLAPLLVAVPRLAGWLHADPMLYTGGMTLGYVPGFTHGYPYIDPNYGYTTQALGYRAALDWISGHVPWWNPYSGIGLPLAGEYQPAAFFPLTLLLLVPQGIVLQHVALQAIAGLGTYGLLRALGVARGAATIGGLLYAFNGTLAWFAHGPAQPLAFLPWMLWGLERAREGRGRGWQMFGLAMALSLLAGFPETAYLDGLLALAWALLRLVQLPAGERARYAARIALGGAPALCIGAPQVVAFAHELALSHVGAHGEIFARASLPLPATITSLVAPYALGPIAGHLDRWLLLAQVWGAIGGYTSIALLAAAAYGFFARRDALAWLLFAWSAAAAAKVFGVEPFLTLWNWIPGVASTAFFRYVQPTWELAMVILAARGLHQLAVAGPSRAALVRTGIVAVGAWVAAMVYGVTLWPHLKDTVGLRNFAAFSALWATLSVFACLALAARASRLPMRRALACLLAFDAMFLFTVPTLANPRGGEVDHAAIAFLREHLGLQRFYSMGPFQPNYGAYFGLASIDHNYLPVNQRWTDWVHARLDRAADPIAFNGSFPRGPGEPSSVEELRRNLGGYRAAGVKFVIVPPGTDPFGAPDDPSRAGTRLAYEDAAMRIFEIASPSSYFDPIGGDCAVRAVGRTHARVDCAKAATLVRRELYSPGWRAEVNGRAVRIDPYDSAFQAIAVPAGASEVRFRYAPPHIEWAWLAFALGCAAFAVPRGLAFRKAG